MSIQDRAFNYVKKQDLSEGYTDLFVEFAEKEIEIERVKKMTPNESNNMKDRKESHRKTQRNLNKATELLKALLRKDDFIKLLQEVKND